MLKFIQYSDSTNSKIISVFGAAQDPTFWLNQGTIDDNDPLYLAFIDPKGHPSISELIEAKRVSIETARNTEEQKGMTYTFTGPVEDVVQLRDNTDKININSQVTAALILKSQNVVDPVMPFQALSNDTHLMTPDEMIAMGTAVNTYVLSLYQKQWEQKTLLDALDPTKATAADIAAIADWPVSAPVETPPDNTETPST